MTGFAELGALTNFSFLEGASHPHELAATAKTLGHAAIGVADRNSFAGVVRAHVAAKAEELRFLPGVRLCLTDGCEYLAWPKDRPAWGRLTRLLSQGRMAAPKGECHIGRDALIAHAQGSVMAMIAPEDIGTDFATRLRADAMALQPHLALPLFCAVTHRYRGDDRQRRDRLARLGIPLLAAGGTRFHAPARRRLADVLTAIRLRSTVDALGFVAEANAEAHLKSPAEMLRLFAGHEEAVTNTQRVVEACHFSLNELQYEYPKEVFDPGRTAQETLEARIAEALTDRKRWPKGPTKNLLKLLKGELALIAELKYAPYFLTVHEIVRFAASKDILFQGRGSAANSAVCFVLGITAADVEEHDLLFARFLSTARNEPPDIDVDFEHERREEVIQHIYDRYGRDRAAICATLSRYRARGAIREVGKALGLTEDITAALAKGVWSPHGDRSLASLPALQDQADPRLRLAIELAQEIEDFPRHLSTHVGGFVITEGPLVELAVVTNAAMEDRTTLEWDKDDIEALRMQKVDVLGLGMLTCLRRGFDLIAQHHGKRIVLRDLKQTDPRVYDMLCKADAIGVFQVESRAQMNMLPRLKPKKFYDLVVEVAIVRPGPIQGDMVHPYLRRRDGLEKPDIPSPAPEHGHENELHDVLKETYGVPLFQEQAMKIAMVAAKFTAEEADQLRRSMATFRHRGGVDRFGDKFIAGMVARGYQREFAERCFSQIEGFGDYGFPESHAVSFALLVYASAWVKCHHPAVFVCALLNSQPMGFYAPAQLVRDAQAHHVCVRPVDVTASDWECTLEPDPHSAEGLALRLGLCMVGGLGAEDAKRITDARAEAPFASIADLARRARLGRDALEALARADAFRGLGRNRRAALWDAAALSGPEPHLAAAEGRETAPRLPRMTAGEQTVLDYAGTGLTLRAHPLKLLRPQLDALGLADTRVLAQAPQGRRLRLPGLVLVRQRPGSAKGVVFFTVEDEHGTANLVLYPDLAERFRAAVVAARLVVAEGTVERLETDKVPVIHLMIRRLTDRSDLLDSLHQLDEARTDAMARADEVRHPDYRRDTGPRIRLPPSRDFH